MSSDRFKVGDRVFFYTYVRSSDPTPTRKVVGTVLEHLRASRILTVLLDVGHPRDIGWDWSGGGKAWKVRDLDIHRMKTDLGNNYE